MAAAIRRPGEVIDVILGVIPESSMTAELRKGLEWVKTDSSFRAPEVQQASWLALGRVLLEAFGPISITRRSVATPRTLATR